MVLNVPTVVPPEGLYRHLLTLWANARTAGTDPFLPVGFILDTIHAIPGVIIGSDPTYGDVREIVIRSLRVLEDQGVIELPPNTNKIVVLSLKEIIEKTQESKISKHFYCFSGSMMVD